MRQRQVIKADVRRMTISDLYLKGFSYRDIASKLKIGLKTIVDDMAIIRTEWQQYSVRKYDEWINEQLAKVDKIECEAWQGWERSQKDEISKEIKVDKDGRSGRKTRRGQAGSPRFLEIALACVNQRQKLIGLGNTEDFTNAKPDGEVIDGAATVVEVVVSDRSQIPAMMTAQQFITAQSSNANSHNPTSTDLPKTS